MTDRMSSAEVVERLGIGINMSSTTIPTAGLLIVRTMHANNEVGIAIGTSNTQSWVDNIGLVRAADIIIQNEMLMQAIASLDT